MAFQKENIEVQDMLVIHDPETLKVISDPTRLEIFNCILRRNKAGFTSTVKNLAETLKVSHTKLYYHINLLEKHGVVKVHHTDMVSGITEKHYQVVAYRIAMDAEIMNDLPDDEKLSEILKSIKPLIDNIYFDIEKSLTAAYELEVLHLDGSEEDPFSLVFKRTTLHLTSTQLKDYIEEITTLVEKYEQLELEETGEPHQEYQTFQVLFEKYSK